MSPRRSCNGRDLPSQQKKILSLLPSSYSDISACVCNLVEYTHTRTNYTAHAMKRPHAPVASRFVVVGLNARRRSSQRIVRASVTVTFPSEQCVLKGNATATTSFMHHAEGVTYLREFVSTRKFDPRRDFSHWKTQRSLPESESVDFMFPRDNSGEATAHKRAALIAGRAPVTITLSCNPTQVSDPRRTVQRRERLRTITQSEYRVSVFTIESDQRREYRTRPLGRKKGGTMMAPNVGRVGFVSRKSSRIG